MPLETGTYIDDLNATNPAATDGLAQADDHIRLIKSVLKTTFPNWSTALTASAAEVDAASTMFTTGPAKLVTLSSLSTPDLTFLGDLNTGLSWIGADNFAAVLGGSKVVDFKTTGIDVTGALTATSYNGGTVWDVGDVKLTYKATPSAGWINPADGSTIGKAGSGATYAGSQYQALYEVLYNETTNAVAPVSGGRSGTAATDFGNSKVLTIPSTSDRAIMGGIGLYYPGQAVGSNTKTIGQGNLPAVTLTTTLTGQGSHAHSIPNFAYTGAVQGFVAGGSGAFYLPTTGVTNYEVLPTMFGSTPLGGSGTALNVQQAGVSFYVHIRYL